jgi:ribosomal protein L29
MALLKAKDVAKMNAKDRESKLADLKMELVKAGVVANKQKAKTKEIKRAIARILTFNNVEKSKELKTK